MKGCREFLTVDEAWDIVINSFSQDTGFLFTIEQSGVIDTEGKVLLEQALSHLHTEYLGQRPIPKQRLFQLCQTSPQYRLRKCLLQYPEWQKELRALLTSLSKGLLLIFVTDDVQEDTLLNLIGNHVFGASESFEIGLRQGYMDEAAFHELLQLIDGLGILWKEKEMLSKKAARTLRGTQDFLWRMPLLAEGEEERIEQSIKEHVVNSLG